MYLNVKCLTECSYYLPPAILILLFIDYLNIDVFIFALFITYLLYMPGDHLHNIMFTDSSIHFCYNANSGNENRLRANEKGVFGNENENCSNLNILTAPP